MSKQRFSKSDSGVVHPGYLREDGQAVFYKYVSYLKKNGFWKDEYLELVASAAASYQNYVAAIQDVNKNGVVTFTQGGAMKKNPAADIAQSCFRDFMAFTVKFGLNPMDSERIQAIEDDSEI